MGGASQMPLAVSSSDVLAGIAALAAALSFSVLLGAVLSRWRYVEKLSNLLLWRPTRSEPMSLNARLEHLAAEVDELRHTFGPQWQLRERAERDQIQAQLEGLQARLDEYFEIGTSNAR